MIGRHRFAPGAFLLAAWCAAAVCSPIAALAQTGVSADDAYEIGREAYIYFYPLVSMDVTRQQTNSAPGAPPNSLANRYFHVRAFPPADFRAVVRPNFDTLY